MIMRIIAVRRCGSCPYIRWNAQDMVCGYTGKIVNPLSQYFDRYDPGKGMPDWCPLLEPERKEGWDYLSTGWNACLDAIEERMDE